MSQKTHSIPLSIQPVDFLEEIANFTFTSKYARYNEKEQRRETWPEAVARLEKMHLKRFSWLSKEDQAEIRWAFDKVREKLVVPSMRSLQFGGKAIEAHQSRIYNCSVRHIDSLRSFAEVFYLLLCGCVPPNTKILTAKGLQEIKNLKVGDLVWSWNKETSTYEVKPITHVHDVLVPKDENIKITGRYGNITTSQKHPILVFRDNQWKYLPAGVLRLGDIINKYCCVSSGELRFDNKAWMAAAFLGDGCSDVRAVGSRRIRLNGDNKSVVKKFAEVLSLYSGLDVKYHRDNRSYYSVPVWKVEKIFGADNLLNINWKQYVGNYNSKKVFDIDIPEWIKSSFDPSVFFSFIAGLIDTDGHIQGSKIFLNTSSKPLVDSLMSYLPMYGIYPWLCTIEVDSYTGSGYTPTKPMYRVIFSITEMLKYASFVQHDVKQQCILDYIMDNREQHKILVMPQSKIEEESQYLGMDSFSIKYNFKYQIEENQCCRSGYYFSRKKSYDHLLSYDQVVALDRNLDIDEHFKDITVQDNHSYICGDGSYYVTHNCGVGIGLSNRFLDRLPDLVDPADKTGTIVAYVVEDDMEGWADSVEALLMCYFKNTPYTGRKITFDYSRIRKKGAPLKTGGGKAPGYRGLKHAHQRIKELLDYIIEDQNQRRIKTINAYDILMYSADAVLSGGIRRSATSVIFDPDDEDMINAKTFFKVDKIRRFAQDEDTGLYHGRVVIGKKTHDVELKEWEYNQLKTESKIGWLPIEPQRARSNNSVLLSRDKVTKEQFAAFIARTRQFGEPGFVFGVTDQLYNPCQPRWASVLTPMGLSTIGNIKEGDQIWSETGWTTVVKKWSTGVKPVYCYQTTAGVFCGTERHKIVEGGLKVEAQDAEGIDRLSGPLAQMVVRNPQDIMDGVVFGDGTVHKVSGDLVHLCVGKDDGDYFTGELAPFMLKERLGIGPFAWVVQTTIEAPELAVTYDRIIPDRFVYGSPARVAGFLRGLYTANGSVVADRITLKATSFKVIQQVQMMLSSLGIASYYTTNRPTRVVFDNGEYLCRESYDLNITGDRERFAALVGFVQDYKVAKLKNVLAVVRQVKRPKVTFDIINVERVSEEEVFDITVDNTAHTYWSGGVNVSNCFEIGFLPMTPDGVCGVQYCNLTSINGIKAKSADLFKEATKAATLIGTLQASYTHFPYLSPAAQQLTEEEALLGVSITGIMDNPSILLDPILQREMAQYAVVINKQWAAKLGIKQAARVTCVKPEGSSSLVLGSASGIHPHHARRYFRRIQCNRLDNVFRHFKKANSHAVEPSVWSVTKTDDIVTFPLTVIESALIKSDLTALKHLDHIKSTQENWVLNGTTEANKKSVTHNVSCTVMVKEDEWDAVIDYLYEHRYYFAAVALLPATGDKLYEQAPMEAITTEEDEKRWADLVSKWQAVDYKTLVEEDDETQLQQEVSCGGGACEIVT